MLPALSGLMCSAGARAAEQSKSPGSSVESWLLAAGRGSQKACEG